jgi:hypothetical protein
MQARRGANWKRLTAPTLQLYQPRYYSRQASLASGNDRFRPRLFDSLLVVRAIQTADLLVMGAWTAPRQLHPLDCANLVEGMGKSLGVEHIFLVQARAAADVIAHD